MKRQSKSYEIALSAIACAIAAMALTLGSYFNVVFAAGYLFGVFALMLPLAKDMPRGAALAHVAASLLACLFNLGGALKLVPFVMFFGLHPVVNYLQKKYVRQKWLHAVLYLIKALWFDGTLLFFWFLTAPLFGVSELWFYDTLNTYLYYFVFIGGTLAFAAYDFLIFLCQKSMNAIVYRLRR